MLDINRNRDGQWDISLSADEMPGLFSGVAFDAGGATIGEAKKEAREFIEEMELFLVALRRELDSLPE